MKNSTTPLDQSGTAATADEQQTATVRMDYGLEKVIFLAKALSHVLSIPEFTIFYIVIELVSENCLRVSFSIADMQLGYVEIRSPGDGTIAIEADTVLQELENRSSSDFAVDCFDFAAAWIRNLGVTLAHLDQFWGCTRVEYAAEARLKRLS